MTDNLAPVSGAFCLPTEYQQLIHQSRYARWLDDEKRRETWQETVDRYVQFVVQPALPEYSEEITESILKLDVLPSMRALMTAGPALERCNIAGYNCTYTSVEHPKRFHEILYILMCGTGLGFSVERQDINRLPSVPGSFINASKEHVVGDSKEGWAKAYKHVISSLYSGVIPTINYSEVRPAGAKLKTFGGRASGPGPLKNLFDFTVQTFLQAAGRKLTSLEIHDIICMAGRAVEVGGVRRSALISLSNLSDGRMANAKSGSWWETNPHRSGANNSAVYEDRPDVGSFMQEWLTIYRSNSGERGIFNREACRRLCARIGRDPNYAWGTNPCSEIVLRPQQMCNLTEAVVRADDTMETLRQKVRYATILGTVQARFTNFPLLSPEWKRNCEEEALLGVSMTGIFDGPSLSAEQLSELRALARSTNAEIADKIGINRSAAITCCKPSGTVSQLADCASGIHPRHSKFYIRRVRASRNDPLTRMMMDQGVPHEASAYSPESEVVFSFPQKSPDGAVTRHDLTAIEHLEKWLHYQKHWCDHKPSVTVSVATEEWPSVGAWVWDNFDWMSGIAVLPKSEHSYVQAPYEDCSKETYEQLVNQQVPIDWSKLKDYEQDDNTLGSQTVACTGNVCEIVDLV